MEQTTKACEFCGKLHAKKYTTSKTVWAKQKYCSWPCRAKAVGLSRIGSKDSVKTRKKKAASKRGKRNPQFGVKQSPAAIANRVAAVKATWTTKKHPSWKGDDADYFTIHKWLNRHYTRKGVCEHCKRETKWTQYANLPGRGYTRNREDYAELCIPCHSALDGRQKDGRGRFMPRAN